MSKRTPGDWTVAFYAVQDGSGGTNVCAVKAGSRTLARTACQVVTGEDEANIRLMAAAPELLGACKIVLKRLDLEATEREARGQDCIFPGAALRSSLRAAIAKAEGRTP